MTQATLSDDIEPERSSELSSLFAKDSCFLHCVEPLLSALNWQGSRRHIIESIPHYSEQLTQASFRRVIDECGYSSEAISISLHDLDSRLLPCVFIPDFGAPIVVLSSEQGRLVGRFSHNDKQGYIDDTNLSGTALLFTPKQIGPDVGGYGKVPFFSMIMQGLKPIKPQLLLISFFLNILGITTPLFIMAVYDKVIGIGSYSMLLQFLSGIFIALGTIICLQKIRNNLFTLIGARLDYEVGIAIFRRLLYLPPYVTENAEVSSQVARIRDFDSVRDFFTGPMFGLVFELPFTIIYVAIIAALAGYLALIPVIVALVFSLVISVLHPLAQRYVRTSGEASSAKQAFLIESLSNLRAIKYSHAESQWSDRFNELSAEASINSYKTNLLTAAITALSDSMIIVSGMILLSFGAIMVIHGTLTIGAMIALMILIWRVLTPIKSIFTALPRLDQVRSGIKQINALMQMKPEYEASSEVTPVTIRQGTVKVNRISMRYQHDMEPALIGLNFEIKAGEIVAISGRNGSGKSSLLKVLLGLYPVQMGTIDIDGVDIRQYDAVELRHAIGYVPQSPEMFYGTIMQNLLMANPEATDADIEEAANKAGLLEDVMNLRHSFNTRLRDQREMALSASFNQRLGLARAYIKKSKLLLLDEPATSLDKKSEQQFLQTMESFRGNTTVFMVTHRPSHMEIADRILLLEQGQLIADGPTSQILPQLIKEYS